MAPGSCIQPEILCTMVHKVLDIKYSNPRGHSLDTALSGSCHKVSTIFPSLPPAANRS